LADMKRRSSDASTSPVKTLSILRGIWAYLIMWIRDNSCGLDSVSWLFRWGKSLSSSLLMLKKPGTIWWLPDTCVDRVHLLAVWWWHCLHWVCVIRAIDSAVHYCSISALPKSLLKTSPLTTRTVAPTARRHWNCLRVNWLLYEASFIVSLLIIAPVWMSTGVYHVVWWVMRVKLVHSNLGRWKPLGIAPCHFICRVANSH
jgi:hypothetical protein